MDIILAVLAIIGVLIISSYLKSINEQLETLRKQVGTLDQPRCNFIPGFKKAETRNRPYDIQKRD